jgi:hypothetical protein
LALATQKSFVFKTSDGVALLQNYIHTLRLLIEVCNSLLNVGCFISDFKFEDES